MTRACLGAALCLLVTVGGCVDAGPEPWSDAWLLQEGERYLEEPEYRREMLLESLENHENTYARERIANYGLETRGWDELPEWNPRSIPLTDSIASDLTGGAEPALPAELEPLWDGLTPSSMEAWIELGRRVFFRYPLRTDGYLDFGVRDVALRSTVGIQSADDGEIPGVIVFRDVDGPARVGIACALCHTDIRSAGIVIGAARRSFDYGALRLAYHDATGVPIDSELRERMAAWGPGRADITPDETEDPVAIPDLWGLRHQSSLTQAGTIRHVGPAALAIRQETQLLHANYQRARPPRVLTLALTFFLYSLEPPPGSTSEEPSVVARGSRLFDASCSNCHHNEVFGGVIVPLGSVGTEPSLALGEARGTGFYRPPALVGVREAAPYFHDGSVPTLDALFDEQRFDPAYNESPLGAGPVVGHRFATMWDREDRAALITFLRSL